MRVPRRFRYLARLAAARQGVSTIEFAVVAPVIALLVIGMIDFGMGLWEEMQVSNAAQAGAAYASINSWNATVSQIETAVTSATSLSGLSPSPAPSTVCGCPTSTGSALTQVTCGTTCADGSVAGHYWIINAEASYSTILPYPGLSNPMTLSATTYARLYP